MNKLILVAVAFAALASPAHADPITGAVVSFFATFGVTVSATTALAIANFAIGTTLSAIGGAIQKSRLGRQGAINVSQTVEMGDDLPLSFTLGEYATPGKRKYAGSWGKNTRFITEVIEFSSLPQGLAGIWINDESGVFAPGQRAWIGGADPSDDSTWFEGPTVPGGSIDIGQPLTNLSDDGNRIVVKVLDGTQTAADPFLIAVFGDDEDFPWTADMIGRGKSYAIVTTRYDSDSLTQYPTFLFEPAPLPVYDLRFDSTNGGAGAQRWGNRATWQPSRNPAVIAYNIARGIYYGTEWVFGGKNLSAWRFPIAEWTAAANACDQTINLSAGGSEKRYRCGLEVSVDMEPASVLEELGRAANMKFAEVGGRLKPIVDLPGAAVFSFTDGDILITESQSFSPFLPAADTFNAITATYPERGEKWTSKDAPEYIDTAAREADGGEYRPTTTTYGAVPFARQVQRLMRSQMRDYRRMRRHQFYLPPDAYALEPGIDMVSWTSERNGYVNKQFLVESVSKTPGLNVLVSLREVDPGDYDWSSDFERPVIITPPVNPRPFVQPIRGLSAVPATIDGEGGIARRPAILVACNGDETGVTHIQIEARRLGSTVVKIDTERPFNEPFAWYLVNVLPLTSYEVRARLMSDLTPRSAWSGWLSVTTLDVRLGSDDLRMDEITQEVRDDIGDLTEYLQGTGETIRDLQDDLSGVRDLVLEQDLANLLARQDVRQSIAVEVGGARASFDELIGVVITDQLAAAIRTSRLEASLYETTAFVSREEIARVANDSALAGRIDQVSASIGTAIGEATDTLVTRIEATESGLAAQSDAITSVTARTNRVSAGGTFRITSVAAPSGAAARAALAVEVNDGDVSQQASMFWEARTDGTNQIIAVADRFAIAASSGPDATRDVPFVVDGGNVYITNAKVRTLSLEGNAVTVPVVGSASAEVRLSTVGNEAVLVGCNLNRQAAPTLILITAQIAGYIDEAIASFRLYRDGGMIAEWPGTSAIQGTQTSVAFTHQDDNLGSGPTNYQLRAARFTTGQYNGEPAIGARTITALHVKR